MTGSNKPSKPKSNGTNGHHAEYNPIRGDIVQHVTWLWMLACLAGIIGMPLFVYWCWVCVEFNQGKMLLPEALTSDAISKWWWVDIWARIQTHAQPTAWAIKLYLGWVFWQFLLTLFAPGPVGPGAVLIDGLKARDGSDRLLYKYNGQFAFFTTMAVVFPLHYTGIFPLTLLYDHFAETLTVVILFNAIMCAILYIFARIFNCGYRMTDSIIYDYFMGPMLNPRIHWLRDFDIKYFFELRPGIMHWFFTTLGLAAKQYQDYGSLSTPMILICFYHLCFVNACFKGEQCVPQSMDIIYEKFGYMLSFLDIVMVPFIFPVQAFYLYKIGPFEHSVPFTVFVASMHILGYWIFDTANSQKDYFREKQGHEMKKGFPRLPWDKLKNPTYLQTERGTKLLTSGWWKYARHMNYLGDIMMSWAWGFTCGFNSYFPYAYTTYLTPLLLHRERRDHLICQTKYGKDWDKYCKLVPYRLIPYVY